MSRQSLLSPPNDNVETCEPRRHDITFTPRAEKGPLVILSFSWDADRKSTFHVLRSMSYARAREIGIRQDLIRVSLDVIVTTKF